MSVNDNQRRLRIESGLRQISGLLDDAEESFTRSLGTLQIHAGRQGTVLAAVSGVPTDEGAVQSSSDLTVAAIRSLENDSRYVCTALKDVADRLTEIDANADAIAILADELGTAASNMRLSAINAGVMSLRAGLAAQGFSVVAARMTPVSRSLAGHGDSIRLGIAEARATIKAESEAIMDASNRAEQHTQVEILDRAAGWSRTLVEEDRAFGSLVHQATMQQIDIERNVQASLDSLQLIRQSQQIVRELESSSR